MLRLSCGYSTNRFHVGRCPAVALSFRLVSAPFARFGSTGCTAFGCGWSYSDAKLTVVISGKGCCCGRGESDFGMPTVWDVLNAELSEAPLSPVQYSNPSSTDPTTTKITQHWHTHRHLLALARGVWVHGRRCPNCTSGGAHQRKGSGAYTKVATLASSGATGLLRTRSASAAQERCSAAEQGGNDPRTRPR